MANCVEMFTTWWHWAEHTNLWGLIVSVYVVSHQRRGHIFLTVAKMIILNLNAVNASDHTI